MQKHLTRQISKRCRSEQGRIRGHKPNGGALFGSLIALTGTLLLWACGDDDKPNKHIDPKAHIYGRVLEADSEIPLEGVSIRAVLSPDGKKEAETVTDDRGRFHLGLPTPGRWVVTATDPDHTFAQRTAEVREGDRAATSPMYLTPIDPKTISIGKSGGTGENSDGTMAIEVPAGALSHGIDIRLTAYSHGWNLPNSLPEASHFTYACDLSPTEQTFAQPVTVRIRNDRGFPAGMPIPVGVYDPQSAAWHHESMGTISEDGQWVVFSVEHFSARDANLGRTSPGSRPSSLRNRSRRRRARRRNHGCSAVPSGSLVGVADGHLTVSHRLVGRTLFGMRRSLRLDYDSNLDRDMVWLAAGYDITQTQTELPERIRFVAEIAGNRWEYVRKPIEAPMTFGIIWNGTDPMGEPLPEGTYHYEITLSNEYRATFAQVPEFGGDPIEDTGIEADELASFPTVIEGDLTYRPTKHDPWNWGVGWMLASEYRLHASDQEVTISSGDHSLFGFDVTEDGFQPWEGEHSSLQDSGDGWTWTLPCGCRRTFDQTGYLTAFEDGDGRTTTYGRDDQGRLIKITEPDGGTTSIQYGTNDMVESLTDPMGRTTTFEYDDQGNLLTITNPDGSSRSFSYDDAHRLVRQTDAAGRTTTYLYNDMGSVIRVNRPDGSHTEHATLLQRSSRDATDQPIGYRDGAGGWHDFWPNEYGTRTAIVDPEGRTILMERNDDDQIVKLVWARPEQDPAKVTTLRYDDKARMVEMSGMGAYGELGQPGNLLVTYDDLNRATEIIMPPMGRWTRTYEDANTRPASETSPDSRTMSATYDDRRLPVSIDYEGGTYSYDYDDHGNLIAATGPSGSTWTVTRDQVGNPTSITDPEGRTTEWTYNPWDLPLSITRAGNTWTFAYQTSLGQDDPSSNAGPQVLTSVTDPADSTTTFEYDAKDRLTSITDPLGNQAGLDYDGQGRLTSIALPGCGTTEFRRDRSGLLTEQSLDTGWSATYSYDPDTGLLLQADCPDLTMTIERDDDQRIFRIRNHFASGFDATIEIQPYDIDTMELSVTLVTDNGSWNSAFEYSDQYPVLPEYIFGGSESWGMDPQYDADGRMTHWMSWTGQVLADLDYDADGKLVRATYRQDQGPTAASIRVSYSEAGLVTGLGTSDGTAQLTYDAAARLVGMTHPEATMDDETFTYDQAGNLRRSGLESEYRYDEAHRLLQDPYYTYEYDAWGNRRSRISRSDASTRTYGYDAQGRLTSVTMATGTVVEYKYDALGRRVERLVDGQPTHRYVWAGADVMAEFDGQGALQRVYPLSLAPDSLRGVSYWDANDAALHDLYFVLAPDDTVLAVVDEDGNLAGTYHYEAFGKPVGLASSPKNTRLFAGMDYDPLTELYYARNRWYDPFTGTYVQPDPVPIRRAMFPYRYGAWAPWTNRDPSGLSPTDEAEDAAIFVNANVVTPGVSQTIGQAIKTIPHVGNKASNVWGTYNQYSDFLNIVFSKDPTKAGLKWYKKFTPAKAQFDTIMKFHKWLNHEPEKPKLKKFDYSRKRRHRIIPWSSCRRSLMLLKTFQH